MRNIQEFIQKLIKTNKGRGRENLIKAGILFISVCVSTLIFINKDVFINLAGYGYFGIFILSVLGSSTIVVPAPTFLATVVGGGLYNPVIVGVVSALGSSFGEITGYLAGMGGKVLAVNSSIYKKIDDWMEKRGFLTIFVLAAIPNPLFDIAGISAGFTNYPFTKYLFATFLGKSVKFLIISLFGYYISRHL